MADRNRPDERLAELASQIVGSFHELGAINHLGHKPLPSPGEVIALAQELKELLFPGYHGRQDLAGPGLGDRVGLSVRGLFDRLAEQIDRALQHEHARGGTGVNVDASELAGEAAIAFLEELPRLRELIAKDVQAAYEGDPAAGSTDEIIFCYPGLEAVSVYRLAHELHRLRVPLIPRMLSEWAHGRTGIDIHPGAEIGAGFFIDHGTGVVIGETCEIAERVKLYQGVTLGALSFQKDAEGNLVRGTKRHPTIERNVVIYANATVLGGRTTIGAHSVIGAGVSVMKSVPPRTVVTVDQPSLRFRDAG